MAYCPRLVALRGSRLRLNSGVASPRIAAPPTPQPNLGDAVDRFHAPCPFEPGAEALRGCPGRQIKSKSSSGDMTNSRALALWGR
jgi:hypothetical protein